MLCIAFCKYPSCYFRASASAASLLGKPVTEIEEAMRKVKEAQSLISAAVGPGTHTLSSSFYHMHHAKRVQGII